MRTHTKEVAEVYEERYPNKDPKERARDLKTRCELARELWGMLSEDEQKKFEDQATKEYNEELAVYKEKRSLVTSTAEPTYQRQVE